MAFWGVGQGAKGYGGRTQGQCFKANPYGKYCLEKEGDLKNRI